MVKSGSANNTTHLFFPDGYQAYASAVKACFSNTRQRSCLLKTMMRLAVVELKKAPQIQKMKLQTIIQQNSLSSR